jgi:hypothetical protein
VPRRDAGPGGGLPGRSSRLTDRLFLGLALATVAGVAGAAWESRREAAARRAAIPDPASSSTRPAEAWTLEVVTVPSDATVIVDGVDRGRRSPVTVPGLARDRRTDVRITRAGYRDLVRTLAPGTERPGRLVAALEPGPGVLAIVSRPVGASVSIGGREVGRTPLSLTALDTTKRHQVEVAAAGHAPATLAVGPESGWQPDGVTRKLVLRVELKPAARGAGVAGRPPGAAAAPPPGRAVADTSADAPSPAAGTERGDSSGPTSAPAPEAAAAGLKRPRWAPSP